MQRLRIFREERELASSGDTFAEKRLGKDKYTVVQDRYIESNINIA